MIAFLGYKVLLRFTHIRQTSVYGSGHEGVAVLLPGFAIIW